MKFRWWQVAVKSWYGDTKFEKKIHQFSGPRKTIDFLVSHHMAITLCCVSLATHVPLARCVKLLVAHAPGMPGTLSPSPTSKETASKRSRHASRHVRDVPWCMSGPLTRGGGEKVPGIPSACANQKITYLARGPWYLIPSLVTTRK